MANVRTMTAGRKKAQSFAYECIFVGVVLVTFVLLKVIPFISSVNNSFTDWNGITGAVNYNGIQNYLRLKTDGQFWSSLIFTVKLGGVSLIGANLIGFTLAYYLTKPMRVRNFLRAGYYLPNVLGGLILGFIWRFIFIKVIPALGKVTGFPLLKLLWLGTPETSFWALAIVEVWRVVGYYMLLYVAGFAAIPTDCLESARIDGASGWQVLRHVTIPLMRPTITRCLFLSIVSGFRIYTLNLSLTDGGPYLSSEGIAMNIYRTAFTENAMGYGSSKAMVFMLVVVTVTLLQYALSSRKEVTL